MKKIVLILICLFSLFVITGCKEEKEIDLEFKVLQESDIEGETITIKFRVRSGVISTALNDELIPAFNEKYPNIKIDLDAISGNYGDLKESTRSELSTQSDNTPDMVIGYPDHFAEYYAGNNMVNLQAYIDDPTLGYSAEELADFLPSYMEENRGYDANNPNDLYGLPFNKSTEVMIYNKTFFEGLFGATWETKIPKTWDEVASVGEEIKALIKEGKADTIFKNGEDKDGNPTYLKISEYLEKGQFYPFGYDSTDNAFITMTRQFKGEYTEKLSVVKGKIKFNNDQVIAGLKYFSDMNKAGNYAISSTWGESYCSAMMQVVKCVMSVGSSAGVNYNAPKEGGINYELGVSEVPYYSEDAKYVIQQGTNICILNQNTNKQRLACWLFTKFLLETENTALFAMATGGYLPVRQSAYETEAYVEYLNDPTEDKKNYSASANTSLNYINNGYTFFVDDAFVGSANIRDQVGTMFAELITTKSEVNNDSIQSLIKKYYSAIGPKFQ